MSPQVIHALKQAGIMIVLAILGVVATEYTGVLQTLDLNPVYVGLVGAIIPPIIRWVEGLRDAERAKDGLVQRSDVGFNFIKAEAMLTPINEYPTVIDKGNAVLVK